MRNFGRIGALAILGLALSVTTTRADETKIPLSEVPKPVLDAFKKKFPKAEIKNAIKEVDKDKMVSYELESMQNEKSIDAVLKPNGEFVNIERQMELSALPAKVTAAVQKKHPKCKMTKAEEVTVGDKVTYEVFVDTADGKKAEVALDKDGKITE